MSAQRVQPVEHLPECGATMAVLGFLFCGEFREGLADRREVEHGVISKPIFASEMVKDYALGNAPKTGDRLPVPGGHDDAHEASTALLGRHPFQFAQNAVVIRLVVRIVSGLSRISRSV